MLQAGLQLHRFAELNCIKRYSV